MRIPFLPTTFLLLSVGAANSRAFIFELINTNELYPGAGPFLSSQSQPTPPSGLSSDVDGADVTLR